MAVRDSVVCYAERINTMAKNYDLNSISNTVSYTSIYASHIHIRGS